MEIREIKENEMWGLLELYTNLHDNKMPEASQALDLRWKAIMADKEQHIIVAVEDGKLVASCIAIIVPNLTHEQRPYAVVENLVTDIAYSNKGYKRAVLDYARDLAMKENCYKIMLSTGSKQNSTMRFYEDAGYNKNEKTAFIQWLD